MYYAANQAEAQACGPSPVAVVGGGNSAGQAALFLSRSSAEVHVIIRGESLQASMSRYLTDRIEQNPRITVWPRTEVTELTGTWAKFPQSGVQRHPITVGVAAVASDAITAAAGPRLPVLTAVSLYPAKTQ